LESHLFNKTGSRMRHLIRRWRCTYV